MLRRVRNAWMWDRAAAAFAGLKRPFTGTQLTDALNLQDIYFDADSATITPDSFETLQRSAEALHDLQSGTRIQIAGYTRAGKIHQLSAQPVNPATSYQYGNSYHNASTPNLGKVSSELLALRPKCD